MEEISVEGIVDKITCDIDPGEFIKSGELYEDNEFPPSDSSLFKPQGSEKAEEWKDYEWKHADEIFGKDSYTVFSGVGPNDIAQGGLGDCYFLSSLSALAEFPERIKNIFLVEVVNSSDLYAVKIFVNGHWRMVVMDAMFPYNTPCKCPAFSNAKEKELWVMLAEKAFAKVNGNYENTEAGQEVAALHALTGAPCQYLNHETTEKEVLWKKIQAAESRNFVICGGAGMPGMSADDYKELGLVSYHAYAVRWANTIQTKSGSVKLLQLRNPWGQFEWKGDWSDSSPLWTSKLKTQCEWTSADDGTFFMSFNDYLRFYGNTSICKVHDDYKNCSFTVSHPEGEYTLIKFTVKEKTSGYFCSNQFKKRLLRNKYPFYETSPTLMFLGKKEKDGSYKYIVEGHGSGFCEYLDFPGALIPGEYIAFVEVEWRFRGIDKLTLNTYTDRSLNNLELLDNAKYPALLAQLLEGAAKEKSLEIKDFENSGIINFSVGYDFGFYVVFANKTKDKTLEGTFEYQLNNLSFTDCGNKIQLNLGPGDVVIKKLKIKDHQQGFGFGTGISYLIR